LKEAYNYFDELKIVKKKSAYLVPEERSTIMKCSVNLVL